jgi:hypothetical protein
MAIIWQLLPRVAYSGQFRWGSPICLALPGSSSPRTGLSTRDAALGSRPGLPYLEHKQNKRSSCQASREPLVNASTAPATVSIRLWSDWVELMTNTSEQIATILARYGEPADGNVWQVEGETFIHHRTLERIAGEAKIISTHPLCSGPGATRRSCW